MLTILLLFAQIGGIGFVKSPPSPNNRGPMCAARECLHWYVEEHNWVEIAEDSDGHFFDWLLRKHPGRFEVHYADLKHYLPGDYVQGAADGHVRVIVKDLDDAKAPIYCISEDKDGFIGKAEPGHGLAIYVRIEARKPTPPR